MDRRVGDCVDEKMDKLTVIISPAVLAPKRSDPGTEGKEPGKENLTESKK